MIPYEAALIAWIPISALLMVDRNSARGFSLAFVLGLMFLPSTLEISLPGVPDIGKENVATIGVLIGTVIFHPRLFDRFRLTVLDLLFLFSIQLAFITSYVNDFGYYDGLSQTMGFFLNFALPVFLARIHLGTPNGLRTFLLTLVAGGVIYAPLALWEFRMSPQIHTKTYGYFQHVFQQHARGGFWRPIVYFAHALSLARFFAFTSFLALFPLRKDLVRFFERWGFGRIGYFVFLAPLLGLVLSQSYGPYLMFILLCTGYFAIYRFPWMGYALPAAAFVWLFLVFVGFKPGYGVVEQVEGLNAQRAQSLGYRLIALQEYREIILNRPWFGHGGWGHGRIEGRATDSQALIQFLSRGFIGGTVYLAWWAFAMHYAYRTFAVMKHTVFGTRAAAFAILATISMTLATIDAGLDQHLLLGLSGLLAIHSWLRTEPQIGAIGAPGNMPHPAQDRHGNSSGNQTQPPSQSFALTERAEKGRV